MLALCVPAGSDAEYVTATTNETVTNSTWIDTTDGSALDVEHAGLYIYGGNASTELVVDSGSEEVALKRVYFLLFFFSASSSSSSFFHGETIKWAHAHQFALYCQPGVAIAFLLAAACKFCTLLSCLD